MKCRTQPLKRHAWVQGNTVTDLLTQCRVRQCTFNAYKRQAYISTITYGLCVTYGLCENLHRTSYFGVNTGLGMLSQ